MTGVGIHHTAGRVVARPFRNDEDYWLVRNLLIETYPITPTAFNWDIRRWDGARWYKEEPALDPHWVEQIRLWETSEGHLVGAVLPEDRGHAHLQLHPDYRHIEDEMLAWAEAHLAAAADDGRQQLDTFAFEYDSIRRRVLEQGGYQKTSHGGVVRRLRFGNKQLPTPVVADDYTLRSTRPGDDGECQRMADLLNAAFERDFHNAQEYWTFITHSPSFRHDLNLVAEASDGHFACHVGLTYEEANRYGVFEPVCTHPEHRRRGLARALMFEGLLRLKALGASDVYVGTGERIPANALYESVGFSEAYKGYTWRKVS
ncbi:MAG: GNAT family N-acetyltransferase [Anaerolineales bacterium]|nr:MAG: GNAT family N-acetyltransferase [Anaerolineales bacterium]